MSFSVSGLTEIISVSSILYHPTSIGGANTAARMLRKKRINTSAKRMFVLGFLSFNFVRSSDMTEDIDFIPMLLEMPIMKRRRMTANIMAPMGLMLTSRIPTNHEVIKSRIRPFFLKPLCTPKIAIAPANIAQSV